ncbi:putative cis-3-chloroacrylic acid protein [Neofusicoccum parvum]|uniref:Cis-3-chloroacrylic acid protein n=1 Tax=Neofusicoccum parvum TaxID=310453 RepID=A0ACB5RVB9_9PEZI|nr:putative cis-3-chloroacrylic acid protein [Neofusicoccum parvum]GME61967.1 putative cis-3-chloroacrylic acid protein [Neofusicoccum parvum]
MPLNALFTRRTLGLTVVGLGASYLLLKTVNPRPQGQQKPTGDYRVETHRSGNPSSGSPALSRRPSN